MNFIDYHNLIVPKYMIKVKRKGSKNPKARVREGGASAFTVLSSFLSVPPSVRRKVLGAKPRGNFFGKSNLVETAGIEPACKK